MSNKSNVKAIVGVQWGDEGKGRMIDYFAQHADVVVRYQGGNNAGHTIVNEHGEFKLHLVPSGIFNPMVVNVLGPGMVIDIQALWEEMEELRQAGIEVGNIKVSERATICFPYHKLQDQLEEKRLGKEAYGSTQRGIAPAYADRYSKKTLQIGELLYPEQLKKHLEDIVEWKNANLKSFYGHEGVDFQEIYDWAINYGEKLKPFIANTNKILGHAHTEGKEILFEAQLGSMRDVYYGIYPYTTSSNVLAGFASIGGGLFEQHIIEVCGVMKAFTSSVGGGPLVSEMPEDEAHILREHAGEYGATTGRPRRVGYFDAVASRYGAYLQGASYLTLTKIDCLSILDTIKIVAGYKIDGQITKEFPINALLDRAEPVYLEMPGWKTDITHCREWDELPVEAQEFIETIEKLVEHPIRYVSVGPERDSLLER